MRKRYIGFAKEVTYGTAVAATEFMDPESESLNPSSDQAIIYPGASGIDDIVKPGRYGVEGSFTVPVDLDATPLFWLLALGEVNTAGAGPFTHTFTASRPNTLASFTARIGKDFLEHVFAGCVVSGLTLEVAEEIASLSVEVVGQKDSEAAINVAPAFSTGAVFASHEVTVDVAAGDVSAEVESLTLTVENGGSLDGGHTLGSRFPRRIYPGSLLVTAEMALAFLSNDHLERFWGQATGPISTGDLTEFACDIHFGASYDIALPRCIQPEFSAAVAGPDRIEQSISYRAVTDPVTGEVISVSVTNDRSAY